MGLGLQPITRNVRTFNLFLSHSWAYSNAYDSITSKLNAKPRFFWRNFSVPKDDPVHCSTDRALRQAIDNKIRLCHVVIVMAGVYSTYSKWINIEIDIAQTKNKPILAIKPWAQTNMSTVVTNAADSIVGWNTDSIVSAIRELA